MIMNIGNGYKVQASEPCNVILAQQGASSAVHIKVEPIVSRHGVERHGVEKVLDTKVFWTIRWADTVKGGWNDFGVVKGKHILSAVRRICKMHATQ